MKEVDAFYGDTNGYVTETVRSTASADSSVLFTNSPSVVSPSSYPVPQSESQTRLISAYFFFSIYTCDEPPSSRIDGTWLSQVYTEHPHYVALRSAVRATCMTGLANVLQEPSTLSQSREYYIQALSATHEALSNPALLIRDTTFLTVVLLAVYEVSL